ncbi:hypothetical protein HK104_006679, partial [Borealophlyctis nickersoniae]
MWAAKPTANSVVSLLSQTNLTIISSSTNQLSSDQHAVSDNTTNTNTTNITFIQVPDDPVALSVRQSVVDRFGGFEGVVAEMERSGGTGGLVRYEDVVGGSVWNVNLKIISFSAYPDGRLLLLVAVPHDD